MFIFSFGNRSQKLILLAVIVVEMTSSMLDFPISVASRRRPEACSSRTTPVVMCKRDIFSYISQLSGISKGFVKRPEVKLETSQSMLSWSLFI